MESEKSGRKKFEHSQGLFCDEPVLGRGAGYIMNMVTRASFASKKPFTKKNSYGARFWFNLAPGI